MCLSFPVWAVRLTCAVIGNPHPAPDAVPQARHLLSGLCSLMRFSDCFSSFMERQAHRAGVGTCSAARASFSSDEGRLLPFLLGCLSLRPGGLGEVSNLFGLCDKPYIVGPRMLQAVATSPHFSRRVLAGPA